MRGADKDSEPFVLHVDDRRIILCSSLLSDPARWEPSPSGDHCGYDHRTASPDVIRLTRTGVATTVAASVEWGGGLSTEVNTPDRAPAAHVGPPLAAALGLDRRTREGGPRCWGSDGAWSSRSCRKPAQERSTAGAFPVRRMAGWGVGAGFPGPISAICQWTEASASSARSLLVGAQWGARPGL